MEVHSEMPQQPQPQKSDKKLIAGLFGYWRAVVSSNVVNGSFEYVNDSGTPA